MKNMTTAPVGKKAATARKKLAQPQAATATATAAAATTTATAADTSTVAASTASVGSASAAVDIDNDNNHYQPVTMLTANMVQSSAPTPAAKSVPGGAPERHDDGDAVESAIRQLKGTRPELMRTSTYYEGAKGIYMCLASLPVLSSMAPTIEAVTEAVINLTPIKPSPEEQAEQKSVAIFDKKICEALSFADDVVDVKKDEAIEGIVNVKKAIHSLGPVQSLVGMVTETYVTVTTVAGDTVDSVASTAGSAVNHVTGATGDVFNSAKSTAATATAAATDATGSFFASAKTTAECAVNKVTGTTGDLLTSVKNKTAGMVDGGKSVLGGISDTTGAHCKWAMSLLSAAIAYPMGFVQRLVGNQADTTTSGASEVKAQIATPRDGL